MARWRTSKSCQGMRSVPDCGAGFLLISFFGSSTASSEKGSVASNAISLMASASAGVEELGVRVELCQRKGGEYR